MNIKPYIFTLVLLGGLFTVLLVNYQRFDISPYQKTHETLNQIQHLDALTQQNMLQVEANHVNNYDQLTSNIQSLNQAYALLVLQLADYPSLRTMVHDLGQTIKHQTNAANHFKREVGVLRNSERYLGTLVEQGMGSDTILNMALFRLKGDLLEFLMFPNEQMKQRILPQQQYIQQHGLEGLYTHTGILLKYAPLVGQRIDTALHCGTPEIAAEISVEYDAIYRQLIQKSEANHTGLLFIGIILVTYIVILIIILINSSRKMSVLNEGLKEQKHKLNHELNLKNQSEYKYRSLIQASSVAIMTYSEKGFISANPATVKVFGFDTEAEILNAKVEQLSPRLQKDGRKSSIAAETYIHQAMKEGSASFEWLHQRRDGEVFATLVHLTAIQIDGERMIQGIVTDISLMQQLEKDKEQLIEALTQVAESILITDTEANILYVNPAFEKLTGYKAEEIVGEEASILRSKSAESGFYENMLETVTNGKVWKGETFIHCKHGEEVLTRRTIAPILNDNGEVVSHVATLHDITEQKENAKKLEHTQRLESLGVLAGGIAHDFNNILTAIMGNAALAERSLDTASPAKINLARIEQATQRAADLCKQMLAYSGKGQFVIKTINVSDLVDEMVHLIEVSIEKNVVIKYHLTEGLPLVEVDVAQLQQIILNLITNANEAIENKCGVVSFSTGVMHADKAYLESSICDTSVPEGRYVYIEVSDTGCGMDVITMEKMFDPFFTTKFTGRGLGMSAVLGIVRGHNGALRVYSELNKGTTFKVLFPASEQAEPHKIGAQPSENSWRPSGVVLVVDDEASICEVVSMMLEDMGFSTLTAKDGVEAVAVYEQHQDDIFCVLLDMTMPRMDGKACFRELRRINKDVKVVLTSGYSEEDATGRFQGKGLAGFIQKPYSPEYLGEALQSLSNQD